MDPISAFAKNPGALDKVLVTGAVEVRQRKPGAKTIKRRADGTPDVSGSPLRLTGARSRFAASLISLLSQAH